MSTESNAKERVTLSRELSDFLIEFSIALHRHSMYPDGHPSLNESAAAVVNHLALLLDQRSNVSLGVAQRQLVIEGVATDSRHPVLASLAERLHGHQIGAMTFRRGVSGDEVLDVLRLLAADPERDAAPLGSGDPKKLQAWKGIQLHPLTYGQLELLEGEEEEEEAADELDPGKRRREHRSAQLWIGLARAAMAVDEEEEEPESTDPGVVAKAINEHPQAQAYDQIIVGYLLQIADELRSEGSVGSAALRRRMSRLISSLDRKTLNRLVEMGGDQTQRRQFMLDATAGLSIDAVLELAQAAAQSSGQTISNSMFRLLTKLSAAASGGPNRPGRIADGELRDQIRTLITGWTLDDPNPDAYTIALDSMATEGRTSAPSLRVTPEHDAEPLRLVYMGLETDTPGPLYARALDRVLEEQGPKPLLRALIASNGGDVSADLWERLATAHTIERLLAEDDPDFELADALLKRTPARQSVNALLSSLEVLTSDDARSGVKDRLLRAGPVAVPIVVERLRDAEPGLQAILLDLIADIGVPPAMFSATEYSRHPDARVRLAALRLGLRFDHERERALCMGLTDNDRMAFRIAVQALSDGVPNAAVPLIANRLSETGLDEEDRAALLRALGTTRSSIALGALLRAVTAGRDLLRRPRIAPASPAVLAGLTTLAHGWPNERRAAAVLRRAQKSKDPEIRSLMERLAAERGA